ncbi:hypothetical protein OBBRIDRAFT_840121 [Obba rivulosa]|uniref:Uncharacterized protein n=1 Tax=Obba rivulosa TaxID=1052685 RepID=A0A8E2DEG6_9APHY|nr:hypothetical protein OBBRIDRAFT_840121 [Obba rivulosa]
MSHMIAIRVLRHELRGFGSDTPIECWDSWATRWLQLKSSVRSDEVRDIFERLSRHAVATFSAHVRTAWLECEWIEDLVPGFMTAITSLPKADFVSSVEFSQAVNSIVDSIHAANLGVHSTLSAQDEGDLDQQDTENVDGCDWLFEADDKSGAADEDSCADSSERNGRDEYLLDVDGALKHLDLYMELTQVDWSTPVESHDVGDDGWAEIGGVQDTDSEEADIRPSKRRRRGLPRVDSEESIGAVSDTGSKERDAEINDVAVEAEVAGSLMSVAGRPKALAATTTSIGKRRREASLVHARDNRGKRVTPGDDVPAGGAEPCHGVAREPEAAVYLPDTRIVANPMWCDVVYQVYPVGPCDYCRSTSKTRTSGEKCCLNKNAKKCRKCFRSRKACTWTNQTMVPIRTGQINRYDAPPKGFVPQDVIPFDPATMKIVGNRVPDMTGETMYEGEATGSKRRKIRGGGRASGVRDVRSTQDGDAHDDEESTSGRTSCWAGTSGHAREVEEDEVEVKTEEELREVSPVRDEGPAHQDVPSSPLRLPPRLRSHRPATKVIRFSRIPADIRAGLEDLPLGDHERLPPLDADQMRIITTAREEEEMLLTRMAVLRDMHLSNQALQMRVAGVRWGFEDIDHDPSMSGEEQEEEQEEEMRPTRGRGRRRTGKVQKVQLANMNGAKGRNGRRRVAGQERGKRKERAMESG